MRSIWRENTQKHGGQGERAGYYTREKADKLCEEQFRRNCYDPKDKFFYSVDGWTLKPCSLTTGSIKDWAYSGKYFP